MAQAVLAGRGDRIDVGPEHRSVELARARGTVGVGTARDPWTTGAVATREARRDDLVLGVAPAV